MFNNILTSLILNEIIQVFLKYQFKSLYFLILKSKLEIAAVCFHLSKQSPSRHPQMHHDIK